MNVCSCINTHNIACFVAASTTHRTVIPVSTTDVNASNTTQTSVREQPPTTSGLVRDSITTPGLLREPPTTPGLLREPPTTPGLLKLKKPVLDLNVRAVNRQINSPWRVAALPAGEAAVVNDGSQVVKINKTGQTIKELYSCRCDLSNHIWGILSLGYNLYVTHKNGTIVEIKPHTGQLINVYHIPDVGYINNHGSLWSNPSKIPNTDILLLPDTRKGEVFSYNLTSRHKQIHLTGLSRPTSVSYSFYNNSTLFVVCQSGRHIIDIYNSSWHLASSFGGVGTADGNLKYPYAAIVSSKHTVLVSDHYNNLVSVFTADGVFLYHLLTQSDGIRRPSAISYYKPYLWVVNSKRLYRYMLYK